MIRRTMASALVIAVAVLATMAPAASAVTTGSTYTYRCTFHSDSPRYVGWARISYRGCVAPGSATTMDCRGGTAWRWSGSSWSSVPIGECGGELLDHDVYAYPFTSGWTWIWTRQTGWLAVKSQLVLVGVSY